MAAKTKERLTSSHMIRSFSVYDFDGKVDDVIQMLANSRDSCIEQGYFNARISVDSYYESVDMYLYADRYETDAEYEKRLEAIAKEKQRIKVQRKKAAEDERKLYEKLKAKYEKVSN